MADLYEKESIYFSVKRMTMSCYFIHQIYFDSMVCTILIGEIKRHYTTL
jgi:hypothetical protein